MIWLKRNHFLLNYFEIPKWLSIAKNNFFILKGSKSHRMPNRCKQIFQHRRRGSRNFHYFFTSPLKRQYLNYIRVYKHVSSSMSKNNSFHSFHQIFTNKWYKKFRNETPKLNLNSINCRNKQEKRQNETVLIGRSNLKKRKKGTAGAEWK